MTRASTWLTTYELPQSDRRRPWAASYNKVMSRYRNRSFGSDICGGAAS